MGKQATVRVTQSNLYRNGHRCSIGERFEVTLNNKGEIPMIYRGKVELDKRPALTTDQVAGSDTGADADEKRRQYLMGEIERMSGKRPGGNTKLETLEERFAELKTADQE
ncbi:hypothetical protein [Vreelandella aquamarina]|uniref:hypothetical protein n=1 Tax=Vreelandella aquamarina TaxID=77097 RepID=UPI001D17E867|nr:hypothetical protein [Halomonas meridiana]MCC4288512.1 hypothetical protein [Halomonas meridiana]